MQSEVNRAKRYAAIAMTSQNPNHRVKVIERIKLLHRIVIKKAWDNEILKYQKYKGPNPIMQANIHKIYAQVEAIANYGNYADSRKAAIDYLADLATVRAIEGLTDITIDTNFSETSKYAAHIRNRIKSAALYLRKRVSLSRLQEINSDLFPIAERLLKSIRSRAFKLEQEIREWKNRDPFWTTGEACDTALGRISRHSDAHLDVFGLDNNSSELFDSGKRDLVILVESKDLDLICSVLVRGVNKELRKIALWTLGEFIKPSMHGDYLSVYLSVPKDIFKVPEYKIRGAKYQIRYAATRCQDPEILALLVSQMNEIKDKEGLLLAAAYAKVLDARITAAQHIIETKNEILIRKLISISNFEDTSRSALSALIHPYVISMLKRKYVGDLAFAIANKTDLDIKNTCQHFLPNEAEDCLNFLKSIKRPSPTINPLIDELKGYMEEQINSGILEK